MQFTTRPLWRSHVHQGPHRAKMKGWGRRAGPGVGGGEGGSRVPCRFQRPEAPALLGGGGGSSILAIPSDSALLSCRRGPCGDTEPPRSCRTVSPSQGPAESPWLYSGTTSGACDVSDRGALFCSRTGVGGLFRGFTCWMRQWATSSETPSTGPRPQWSPSEGERVTHRSSSHPPRLQTLQGT